jgi:DNA-binding NtrC family response regulator
LSPPRIVVVDDDPEMVRLIQVELARLCLDVLSAASGQQALQALRDHPVDVVVTDLRMPDLDGMELLQAALGLRPDVRVIVITAFGSIASAIAATRAGAFDYLSKPFEIEELALAVQKALEDARLRRENIMLRGEVERRHRFGDLVGKSAEMQEVFRLIERVAASDVGVLITGESGTGKELVARAIHYNGSRRRGLFVPINCAGIPETLLESELFGYMRGAFTGANVSRKGLIEEAHGGTLFLDEIAEMSMLLQAKLLRVLGDKEVRPLGSNRGSTVDFRVIAATNRDLRALVAADRFREELFFRLNVAAIHLPPLRERREDLPALVDHFLERNGAAQERRVRGISRDAVRQLEAYAWPGNVRELQNAIERAVTFAQGDIIQPDDLPAYVMERDMSILDRASAERLTLRALHEQYIERMCAETRGDLEKAAAILGVHPRTLRRRARRQLSSR